MTIISLLLAYYGNPWFYRKTFRTLRTNLWDGQLLFLWCELNDNYPMSRNFCQRLISIKPARLICL